MRYICKKMRWEMSASTMRYALDCSDVGRGRGRCTHSASPATALSWRLGLLLDQSEIPPYAGTNNL